MTEKRKIRKKKTDESTERNWCVKVVIQKEADGVYHRLKIILTVN